MKPDNGAITENGDKVYLAAFMESMRDSICICVGGKINHINASGLALLGFDSEEQVVGRKLLNFIPNDYKEAVLELLSLKVRESSPVPIRLTHSDNQSQNQALEVEISFHPVRELGDDAVMAVMRDITQEGKLARDVRLSQMRFRQLVDHAMHLICVCTGERVDYINKAGVSLLGAGDARELIGRSLFDFMTAEYREIFAGDVATLIAERGVIPVRLARLDGSTIDAQIGISVLPSKKRAAVEFMLEVRDITAHNRAVAALRRLNETLEQRVIERTRELAQAMNFLNTLIETIPNPLWHKDLEGHFRGYNKAFRELRGIGGDEWLGRTVGELYIDRETVELAESSDIKAISSGTSVVYEYSFRPSGGEKRDLIVSKTAYPGHDGNPAGTIGVMTDVTEMKRLEEELRRLATTDPLTGAFNRRHFMESAEKEIARSQRHDHSLAVLMFDIDKFKLINDNYGHPMGDEAIKALAETLKDGGRSCDLVGRLGGEEFAMLLPETGIASAIEVAERLRRTIMEIRIQAGERTIAYTSSIGVSELKPGDQGIADILSRADEALYEAKRSGRNRVIARP